MLENGAKNNTKNGAKSGTTKMHEKALGQGDIQGKGFLVPALGCLLFPSDFMLSLLMLLLPSLWCITPFLVNSGGSWRPEGSVRHARLAAQAHADVPPQCRRTPSCYSQEAGANTFIKLVFYTSCSASKTFMSVCSYRSFKLNLDIHMPARSAQFPDLVVCKSLRHDANLRGSPPSPRHQKVF